MWRPDPSIESAGHDGRSVEDVCVEDAIATTKVAEGVRVSAKTVQPSGEECEYSVAS